MRQQMSTSSSSSVGGTGTENGKGFHRSRSSGSRIQIPLCPKRPGDSLLIATIFQGQELKALCGTFNDLLQTVMLLAMAL